MVQKAFDLENYRNEDGTIDLLKAFEDKYKNQKIDKEDANKVFDFIVGITSIYPIKSRQAAALCLVQAAVYIGIDQWSL